MPVHDTPSNVIPTKTGVHKTQIKRWPPAFVGMNNGCVRALILILATLISPSLFAEDVPENPYVLAQEVQKLEAEIVALEASLKDSEKNQAQLREEISHALPLLIRYARRNPLEFMVRPQEHKNVAKERALIGSLSTKLSRLFTNEKLNFSENSTIRNDILRHLQIKKEALSELVMLHQEYTLAQKEKIAALEKQEHEKITGKKLSVNELLNESQISRGKKPILPASESALPILRLDPPITGKIVGLYDEQMDYSPHSKGIVFEGKKGGLIMAPAHGVVKYVGKFREHDPIAIIDHGEKTTTILIGAESFSVQPGQSIYMGQTLGKLPGYGANAPRLYMEFRHSGKYIDPMPFFSDNASN
ncbi:M23 family metallopeptidase [Candidatus Bealeia paramacronuclearis]|uniref:M23 family metallopeptidase n=1 Tax=Candidatus Bealeia paramacronuclearis TaxID=1921001 RepID=A0ABZ2C011_9PROT|nr:M23 family metallopeptidase [Candidatus Bealeia paramacronuclearis]